MKNVLKNKKNILVITVITIVLIITICMNIYHYKTKGEYSINQDTVVGAIMVDGTMKNIQEEVQEEVLKDIKNVNHYYYLDSEENRTALIDFLSTSMDYSLFYQSLYAQENEDGLQYLVLKSKFNYKKCVDALGQYNLTSRTNLKTFLDGCKYSNQDNDDSDPITLLQEQKGNCNAFTMLIYIYLNEYEHTTEKTFISEFDEALGYAHIYLKVKEEYTASPYIVDYTKNLYLN